MIWSRWSGAGNTFFILECSTEQQFRVPRHEIAMSLCQMFPNGKTDGVLFLDQGSDVDAVWDFYNSDGSTAEMCGNAARCATLHWSQKNGSTDVHFLTKAGRIHSKVLDLDLVEVEMPPIRIQQRTPVFLVNTGVPHVVFESEFSEQIVKMYRHYPDSVGSNVTFVSEVSEGRAKAVTFERGVEGLTLACGTGAVAAAAFLTEKQNTSSFSIEMPGGILKIEKAKDLERPKMTGSAVWCFDLDDGGAWENH